PADGRGHAGRGPAAGGPAGATPTTAGAPTGQPSPGPAAASEAAGAAAATPLGPPSADLTPAPRASASGDTSAGGLQSPSFHGREHHHALELLNAEAREANRPVTRAQAAEALRALPSDTRHGVAGLAREHGAGAREHLAYQALGDWSDEQRDA